MQKFTLVIEAARSNKGEDKHSCLIKQGKTEIAIVYGFTYRKLLNAVAESIALHVGEV